VASDFIYDDSVLVPTINAELAEPAETLEPVGLHGRPTASGESDMSMPTV
jgi:hypothetical protein